MSLIEFAASINISFKEMHGYYHTGQTAIKINAYVDRVMSADPSILSSYTIKITIHTPFHGWRIS